LPMDRSRGDRPRRGFGDGRAEKLGDASVAPVVHVEAVGRHESVERQMLHVVPIAHHGEAPEEIDIFLLRGERNLLDHAGRFRFGEHRRRELWIDQDHVGPGILEFLDALAKLDIVGAERVIAQHGIRADLPQDELRMRRHDVGGESRHHVIGLFTIDPAVEDADFVAGEFCPQLDGEPAWIARLRRRGTGARRR
jgi:hypothetical protein